MSKKICCLCKGKIIGYGNNAEPLRNGKCCDNCNIFKVIPERLRLMNEKGDIVVW